MYEGHFHLDRRPFAATPDPGCCYLSPTQTPLIQSVARCIEHGQGVAILTGPAGIGKTLIAQVLLSESESRFTGVYLGTGQFPTRRALLQAILYELGQPYGGMTDQELRLELNTALRNLITQKDGLLLVLDEVHLLSDRMLEEVRLLADLAQQGVPLTHVVLCGNPEFEERLTSPALAALNQRVACHVVLETLTRPESISYLEYRIEWAGGVAERLFEREALQLIADASDGVPRCLNQLADHSLMQAYLSGLSIVDAGLVRRTLGELQRLPLRWNPSALHDRSLNQNASVTTTIVETAGQPSLVHSAAEAEVVNDGSTCCFEFGAGDETLGTDTADIITAQSTREPTPFPAAEETIEFSPSAVDSQDAEEDGPPLFPWLAKPVAKVSAQVADEFASSSFNIPARRRIRAVVVEQEVVNMAPLSGSELLSKRRPAVHSPSSSPVGTIQTKDFLRRQGLPAEEVVVDLYAELDYPLTPTFPKPIAGPTKPVPTNVVEESRDQQPGCSAAAGLHVREEGLDDGSARISTRFDLASNPLERIDALCELLEEAVGTSQGSGGVELITDHGIERIDIDLPATTELHPDLTVHTHQAFDLESLIGSTVVEVGRNLQQGVATSPREPVSQPRANHVEHLLDSIERESRYDIVEPDSSAPTGPTTNAIPAVRHPAEGHSGAVPAPNHNFKNFFSMLRRRQVR